MIKAKLKYGHMTRQERLENIEDWKNNKPSNNSEWDEDLKEESLHFKHDYQLKAMEKSHEDKLPRIEEQLDKLDRYPDIYRYKMEEVLKEEFSGQELADMIEVEFQELYLNTTWKVAKLEQSIERIKKERELRKDKLVTRKPIGTTYYVDFDNGHDVDNDGSSAVKTNGDGPWATLDKFTENARSAGDDVIVRGSMIQTVTSDLLFTSDGTLLLPIEMKRDFGDEWSDHVDLSGTETATLTFGSKTVTYSGDISGVLAAGDWIYVDGEDNTEYSYEVASVATAVATLYLPYKGDEAGSGKTTYNMGDNPIWNTAAGSYQVSFQSDQFWQIQGLHFRGTDNLGVVVHSYAGGIVHRDVIAEGNGTSDYCFYGNAASSNFYLYKCRGYNAYGMLRSTADDPLACLVRDCYFDGNNVNPSAFYYLPEQCHIEIYDSEQANVKYFARVPTSYDVTYRIKCRNMIAPYATDLLLGVPGAMLSEIKFEDFDNVLNDSRFFNMLASGVSVPSFQSETTKVRGGGAAISIKVTPSTNINTQWEHGYLKIFEIPIFATTASKTYTIFFACDDNTDWDDDPTAVQLWVELEAWGHATNKSRKITKSTGTVDFKTDTDFDQSLDITVAPAQEGVAYLRVYYAKPKEATNLNIFYVDPIPVIT